MLEVINEAGSFQLLRDHHGLLFLYEKGRLVPCVSSRDALEQFQCLVECINNRDMSDEIKEPVEIAIHVV